MKIFTIGVYGFDCDGFFRALTDAGVDTFVDIRLRRGMRGSTYAFANSTKLQDRLEVLNIRYAHIKELAPGSDIREMQKAADERSGVAKRTRVVVGDEFRNAYSSAILAKFDLTGLIRLAGPDARNICLFCVEREPLACHRSIVADRLSLQYGFTVEHILP